MSAQRGGKAFKRGLFGMIFFLEKVVVGKNVFQRDSHAASLGHVVGGGSIGWWWWKLRK